MFRLYMHDTVQYIARVSARKTARVWMRPVRVRPLQVTPNTWLITEPFQAGPVPWCRSAPGSSQARFRLSQGLVLIDSEHVDYTDRRFALIERLGGGRPPRPEYMDPAQNLLLDRTISQVRDAALRAPLPDVRLEVVVHGEPAPEQFAAGTPEHADAELWLELQRERAALVPGGRTTVVAGASHDIPADRPQAVIEAVRRVLRTLSAESANSGERQAHRRDERLHP